MIVCSCNVLSDRDVRGCLNPGADCPRTPAQVYRCLGCSAQCGTLRTTRTPKIRQDHGCDPAPESTPCAGLSRRLRNAIMNESHGCLPGT